MGKSEDLEKELNALKDRVQIEKSAAQVEFISYKKKMDERESNLLKESEKKLFN